MKKLLVVGTRGIPGVLGGVETHCRQLYPRLAALGCRVTVMCRKRYTGGRGNEYKGVQLIHLAVPSISGLEALLHTLLGIIYGFARGFRIVHIHGIGPALCAPLARFLGMKVLLTHHGEDYNRQKWGFLSKMILKLGESRGVRSAHRVIAVSASIKHMLEQKYHTDKVTAIPNGVEFAVKDSSTGYLHSLGLEPGGYFLSVSRFVPEKGLHDLILAYGTLPHPRLKLVLAGSALQPGTYSRRLGQLAGQYGCVLTGYITGAPLQQLYTHARCFVLPSYHEGFSFALLEAAAYGLDILASDIPANRELELDEDCYFPAGAGKLLALKMQQRTEIPGKCSVPREVLEERYNWDRIAGKTQALLNCL